MANTPETIIEAHTFSDQLIEKTLAKKLIWAQEAQNDFWVKVGGFRFNVYRWENNGGHGIAMQDESGSELLRVDVPFQPRYGYSSSGEEQLSVTLARLHELARRKALDVDSKVNQAKNLLLAL
jgi:hypothetical protein